MCAKLKIIVGICVILALSLLLYVTFKQNKKEFMENKRITLYFSPTCSHCRAFEETWKKFKVIAKNINVASDEINCVENGNLCQNIQGYPTLILENGGKQIKFDENRTIENLTKFIKNN